MCNVVVLVSTSLISSLIQFHSYCACHVPQGDASSFCRHYVESQSMVSGTPASASSLSFISPNNLHISSSARGHKILPRFKKGEMLILVNRKFLSRACPCMKLTHVEPHVKPFVKPRVKSVPSPLLDNKSRNTNHSENPQTRELITRKWKTNNIIVALIRLRWLFTRKAFILWMTLLGNGLFIARNHGSNAIVTALRINALKEVIALLLHSY